MMTQFLEEEIFNLLQVGVFKYQIHPRRKIIFANSAMAKIFGFSTKDEIKKLTLDDLIINTKDKDDFFELIKKEGKTEFFEVACQNKKDKVVWVTISAHMVKGSNNHSYIDGIVQNISHQKDTIHKVPQEHDTLQTILDSIPDAIYFKDRKNRITRVNKFYAQGFKGRLDKILGKTDFDFFPKEQAKQMFSDDNSILKTGKPIVGKIERTLLPNGTWNQVITTKIPIYDTNGKVSGTMGITRDMTLHANLERERLTMALKALMVLGRALEMRDPYTTTHGRDVGIIAHKIGEVLKFNEDKLMALKIAAELHDLGKIGIPLDLLIKPGRLSDLEYRLIKEHTTNCYKLIKDIEFPFPLADMIYQHHERIDGSGYPLGLKGNKILLESRILAVSDVLEAMTNHRPYRAALGVNKAIEELKNGAGIKYDAKIVDIALQLLKQNKNRPFWNGSLL